TISNTSNGRKRSQGYLSSRSLIAGGSLAGTTALTASPVLIAPEGATLGGAGIRSPALMRATTFAGEFGGRSSRFVRAVPGRTILRNGADVTTEGTTLSLTWAEIVRPSAITRLCTGAVRTKARSLSSETTWRACHESKAACAN